jgi:hypothetical protein
MDNLHVGSTEHHSTTQGAYAMNRQVKPNEALSNGTQVQMTCGSGRRGIVTDCYFNGDPMSANVHTVKVTHKHNGLSGKRGAWIPYTGHTWNGNYRFLMVRS